MNRFDSSTRQFGVSILVSEVVEFFLLLNRHYGIDIVWQMGEKMRNNC